MTSRPRSFKMKPGAGRFRRRVEVEKELRVLVNLLLSAGLAYVGVLVLVFLFQSRLVFYPGVGREVMVSPQTYGLKYESLRIPTADGETLHAWWVPADDARGT